MLRRNRDWNEDPPEVKKARADREEARQRRLQVIREAAQALIAKGIPAQVLPNILFGAYDSDDVWIILGELGVVPQ
jgi:hypothetical protein